MIWVIYTENNLIIYTNLQNTNNPVLFYDIHTHICDILFTSCGHTDSLEYGFHTFFSLCTTIAVLIE